MVKVVFAGVAEGVRYEGAPFPLAPADIYRLSQLKQHFLFPVPMNQNVFLFFVHRAILTHEEIKRWRIIIEDPNGMELGGMSVEFIQHVNYEPSMRGEQRSVQVIMKEKTTVATEGIAIGANQWVMIGFAIPDLLILEPCDCKVIVRYDGNDECVGLMSFRHVSIPPLSSPQIRAIRANPLSPESVKYVIECKLCGDKIVPYTALARNEAFESEGCVWQYDLPDQFVCKCGKTSLRLGYIRENFHGMLMKAEFGLKGRHEFTRRYRYREIVKIAENYYALLDMEKGEKPFQDFIEKNNLMLARFHPSKILDRPPLLGKYIPDFLVVDSQGQLLVIEIEKPSIQLFKKNDGHPTSFLNHAYEQVNDWILAFNRNRGSCLDSLKLKEDEVASVKGVVIAGRATDAKPEHLQRHLFNTPYGFDFLTHDDLPAGLIMLAKELA